MSARMLEAALLGRVGAVTKGGDGAQERSLERCLAR